MEAAENFTNWIEKADCSWYEENAAKEVYEIRSAEQLAGLAKLVNEGNSFDGKTIKLLADIDLQNVEWTPIGNDNQKTFNGTFDAYDETKSKNHVISDLKITKSLATDNHIGLFGNCGSKATLKNIDIQNVDLIGRLYVGAIAGRGYLSNGIENCHVYGSVEIEGYWYVGGISGRWEYTTDGIKECSVKGTAD